MIKAEDIKPCGGVSTVVIVEEGATSGGIDNANLAALAALVSAADKLPYFTGSGAAALVDLSSFSRTLLPAANAAAARGILGVDLTAPGPIGAGTPSTGAFTDLVCETLEVTNGLPVSAIEDTWDDSGTTYVGVGIDVTDTASAAESRLFRARLGGAEKWAVRKDGQMVTTGDILVGNGVFVKNAVAQTFFYFDWSGNMLAYQDFQPYSSGYVSLGQTSRRWKRLWLDATVTAGGTTGAQTINKAAGSVNFAAAATSLVVTNSLVSTDSIILATVATNDATMTGVQAVAGSGSFTLYATAAATAETRVNFHVIN